MLYLTSKIMISYYKNPHKFAHLSDRGLGICAAAVEEDLSIGLLTFLILIAMRLADSQEETWSLSVSGHQVQVWLSGGRSAGRIDTRIDTQLDSKPATRDFVIAKNSEQRNRG